MDMFAPALRRIADELDLPRRTRAAILLEMAADLEAVYEHHRRQGLPEEEAARRAEETVLASSEVIRRLGRLHRIPWRGWAEEAGERLTEGFELVLLLVCVLPALVVSALMAAWVLRAGGSPLTWLLVVTGVLMVLTTARPGASRRSSPPGTTRPGTTRPGTTPPGTTPFGSRRASNGWGVSPLLVLSAMAPVTGLLAVALGVQATAATMADASLSPGSPVATALRGVTTAPLAGVTAARLAGDAAVAVAALLLGLSGLLTWFVLVGREARRAADEVESLLAGGAPEPDSIPLVRRRQG